MYFQGKNPFRQSKYHQIWGPKAASRPINSGFEIALSGQIPSRPPAAMSSDTPMESEMKLKKQTVLMTAQNNYPVSKKFWFNTKNNINILKAQVVIATELLC